MKFVAPIITSLMDTDLYKLTMAQTYLHQMPGFTGTYRFQCRNPKGTKLGLLKEAVEHQLDLLCSLQFTDPELKYLSGLRYLKPDFIEYLRLLRLPRNSIKVWQGATEDDLHIEASGSLVIHTFFEIYVLAIVSELYFRRFPAAELLAEGELRLNDKIGFLQNKLAGPQLATDFIFSDFGTRRRYSKSHQEHVVTRLAREFKHVFRGTSNLYLAMTLGLTAIGTMAHEYLQAHQAAGCRLRDFQKLAFEHWVQEYRGDLGIALTDVISMDAFLADFDLYFAKLFDGARHDSGDPVAWGEKLVQHYLRLNLKPLTKTMVFSDGLSFVKAWDLYQHFGSRICTSYGIGTDLTNDMGVPALSLVMKLVTCNEQPVAKLSDSPGKTMCQDQGYLAYLSQVFK